MTKKPPTDIESDPMNDMTEGTTNADLHGSVDRGHLPDTCTPDDGPPVTDDLQERRDEMLGRQMVGLGPKGQALWAELEERDRQRPGEPDAVYEARMILTKGAADIKFARAMILHGKVPHELDMGIPLPGTGCPVNVRPGVRCGRPLKEMGLCGTHLAEIEATATEEERAELQTVREGIALLDALDRPADRDIARARSWARKLGLSLSVNRAKRPVPRFTLYTSDRRRQLAGGMTFSAALVLLLELPDRASKAPQSSAGGEHGSKAAEARHNAAQTRREADERRAARKAERDARRAEERPAFEGQCTGTTKLGRRCRFPADGGDGRCSLHRAVLG